MRRQDIVALFDYGYWATWTTLDAVAKLPVENFTTPTTITWRNLRGTLVHTLDVEQSWRRRLQGVDRSAWDAELPADAFPTVPQLEEAWRSDATEMRTWLATLDDAALSAVMDLGPRDRLPLWYFLLHIVTHGIEQRRDVATLLRSFGVDPPQLEFLWYADSLDSERGE